MIQYRKICLNDSAPFYYFLDNHPLKCYNLSIKYQRSKGYVCYFYDSFRALSRFVRILCGKNEFFLQKNTDHDAVKTLGDRRFCRFLVSRIPLLLCGGLPRSRRVPAHLGEHLGLGSPRYKVFRG